MNGSEQNSCLPYEAHPSQRTSGSQHGLQLLPCLCPLPQACMRPCKLVAGPVVLVCALRWVRWLTVSSASAAMQPGAQCSRRNSTICAGTRDTQALKHTGSGGALGCVRSQDLLCAAGMGSRGPHLLSLHGTLPCTSAWPPGSQPAAAPRAAQA